VKPSARLLALALACAPLPLHGVAAPPALVADTLFVTVAQDGSGDATTIQGGLGFPGDGYPRVVRVMSGYYDEVVQIGPPPAVPGEGTGARGTPVAPDATTQPFDLILIAPAGPTVTTVRGFAPTGAEYALVSGLRIEEHVIHRSASPLAARWEDCIFEGGYTGHSYICVIPNLFRCEFLGPTCLLNYSSHFISFEDLRFSGKGLLLTTSNEGNCGPLRFVRCAFEGPADTAVFAIPKGENFIELSDCSFTDCDYAIVARQNPDELLRVTRSRFTDMRGVAIILEHSGSIAGEPLSLHVDGSLFERCGRAVRWMPQLSGPAAGRHPAPEIDGASWFNGSFTMLADTVLGCSGPAIEAQIYRGGVQLDGLIVTNGADAGVRLTLLDPPNPWTDLEVRNSTITGNAGTGLSLVDEAGEPSERSVLLHDNVIAHNDGHGIDISARDVQASGNVIHANGGDGFRLHTLAGQQASDIGLNTIVFNQGAGLLHTVDPTVDPTTILLHNNLVVRNMGEGIRADGIIRHNDSWMNPGGDFAGAMLEENLSVDPAFCDAGAENFTLLLGSVCGPDGPFGRIGALGIGCAPTATQVSLHRAEVVDGIVRLSWHTTEPVVSAQVERRTEDTPWAPAGSAFGDGRDILSFEEPAPSGGRFAYRLVLDGLGEARHTAETWVEIPATSFALRISNPSRGGTIAVELSFPSPGGAVLELLDLAGRRVESQQIATRIGAQSLTLGGNRRLAQGVYLIRVIHAGMSRTERAIVIR